MRIPQCRLHGDLPTITTAITTAALISATVTSFLKTQFLCRQPLPPLLLTSESCGGNFGHLFHFSPYLQTRAPARIESQRSEYRKVAVRLTCRSTPIFFLLCLSRASVQQSTPSVLLSPCDPDHVRSSTTVDFKVCSPEYPRCAEP